MWVTLFIHGLGCSETHFLLNSAQALVKTDMPSPRSLNSIQSKDHGLILFCPIDEGKTRIGYVFNKELQGKYGEDGVTVEVAKEVGLALPLRSLISLLKKDF